MKNSLKKVVLRSAVAVALFGAVAPSMSNLAYADDVKATIGAGNQHTSVDETVNNSLLVTSVLTPGENEAAQNAVNLSQTLQDNGTLSVTSDGIVVFNYNKALADGMDIDLANQFRQIARSSLIRGDVGIDFQCGPQARAMGRLALVTLATSYAAGAFSALLALSPIAYAALIAVFAACVGAAVGAKDIKVSVPVPFVSWTKTIKLP